MRRVPFQLFIGAVERAAARCARVDGDPATRRPVMVEERDGEGGSPPRSNTSDLRNKVFAAAGPGCRLRSLTANFELTMSLCLVRDAGLRAPRLGVSPFSGRSTPL